jgi:hypothetical protein
MARVFAYVDGFNLFYGALKGTPFKWLNLDVLCRTMLPGDSVERINYYTANVSARPTKPNAPNNQQIYLRALRTIPTVSITLGHFLTHSVSMPLSGTGPTKRVWVDRTEEKGSDVNLGAHLVRDGFLHKFEVAVLVTNDSDLAEPVRIVTRELGRPVGILNPHEHHSKALRPLATFVKRIRQTDLIASQFPSELVDAKGRVIRKPPDW